MSLELKLLLSAIDLPSNGITITYTFTIPSSIISRLDNLVNFQGNFQIKIRMALTIMP